VVTIHFFCILRIISLKRAAHFVGSSLSKILQYEVHEYGQVGGIMM